MDEALVKKRILELAYKASERNCCTYTDFLGIAELHVFHSMNAMISNVPAVLFGGAEGCERQMIRFCPEELSGNMDAFPIACIRIRPLNAKFADSLTHRDVLGALMNLGFERDLLGDIIIRENESFAFALERIAPYIAGNLKEIKHTQVRCDIVTDLPEGALFRLERTIIQAASERADAVAARVYQLSRGDSQNLFASGNVAVNGQVCEKDTRLLKEGDIVSVRGYGRFVFHGTQSLSKKGKHNIAIDLYV